MGQQDGRAPGVWLTPGVEVTTLGQGLATGVGLAMAEAHLSARYNRPEQAIVDHFTYVLATDGDMMEGVAAEAASLAGHLRLGKLICLYDSNDISLDGATSLCFTEDVAKRFEAYGWHVLTVEDGNINDAIDAAVQKAKANTEQPSLLVIRTQIGYGSPNAAPPRRTARHLARMRSWQRAGNWGGQRMPISTCRERPRCKFRKALEKAQAQAEWEARFRTWAEANPALAQDWTLAFSASSRGMITDPGLGPEGLPPRARRVCSNLNAIAGITQLFGARPIEPPPPTP